MVLPCVVQTLKGEAARDLSPIDVNTQTLQTASKRDCRLNTSLLSPGVQAGITRGFIPILVVSLPDHTASQLINSIDLFVFIGLFTLSSYLGLTWVMHFPVKLILLYISFHVLI